MPSCPSAVDLAVSLIFPRSSNFPAQPLSGIFEVNCKETRLMKITIVCIGMHLAKIEIRMGAALFFKKFPNAHMSTRDGMTLEEMNPLMYFMATPRGMRCLVDGN